MTQGNNFTILIQGKEGIFNKSLQLTMFHEHETTESFTEQLKTVRRELGKMVKCDRLIVTIQKTDRVTYNVSELTRYCFGQWAYQGTFELEVRPFNQVNRDYSTINLLNFVTFAQLMNYLINNIKRQGLDVLGEIPKEGKGWYAQELEMR